MDTDQFKKPIVIVGCTASGKSDLAEGLVAKLGGEIMAVDSMQVYRGMDIGTAKPDAGTRGRIRHWMIDVADPWESYSAARFVEEARTYLNHDGTTPRREGRMILVAGTFLYLRGLMEGLFQGPSADAGIRAELQERAAREGTAGLHAELTKVDPAAGVRIHPNDLRRIVRALEVHRIMGTPISELQTQWSREHPAMEADYVGVWWEKEALSRRINLRVKRMMEMGLVEEVDRLRRTEKGFSEEAAAGVGYRQLLDHFAGKCTLEDAVEQIKIQTRYLAKMQRTWLKRWPTGVRWIEVGEGMSGEEVVARAVGMWGE